MIKKIFVLFLLVFISTSLMVSVHADVGPKPTTEVEIIGFDQVYYFDVLFKVDESDVRLLDEEAIQERTEYDYYRDDFPDILNGFQDDDGYASYSLYSSNPHNIDQLETHKFHLGYYSPPNEFKIVLVLENDEMIISNVVNKTLFNATFTFDLSDFSLEDETPELVDGVSVYLIEEPSPRETIPWGMTLLQIVLAVIFTIIIEMFVLFVFRYNKKSSYKLVLYINLITQFLFHSILIIGTLVGNIYGFILVFVFGELLVLIIELILYIKYLKEKSKLTAAIYALLANLMSAFLGTLLLAYLLSVIF